MLRARTENRLYLTTVLNSFFFNSFFFLGWQLEKSLYLLQQILFNDVSNLVCKYCKCTVSHTENR